MNAGSFGRRTFALGVSAFCWALFQTFLIPALPALRTALDARATWTTWVVTAYILVGCVLTPVLSRVADQHGKRRVILWCLAVFVLASVGAMASTSIAMLVAFRALQGVALVIFPLTFALVNDEYPAPKAGPALGIVTGCMGLGGGLGLVLSGVVLDLASWPWLFAMADVFAVIAFVAVWLWVPESPLAPRTRPDIAGAVLLSLALLSLLVALSDGPNSGWDAPLVVGAFIAFAVLLAVWVSVESRRADPMVSLASMRLRPVLFTNVVALLAGMAMYLSYIILPELLQLPAILPPAQRPEASYGLGVSATEVGLLLFPGAVAMAVLGPVAGLVMDRLGPTRVMVVGQALCALGAALLALFHSAPWMIAVGFGFGGAGWAVAISAAPRLIGAAVPPTETGVANGLNSTIRITGTIIGGQVSVAIIVVTAFAGGVPAERGFVICFWLAAAASLAATAAAMLTAPRRRPGLAGRSA